jgi:hypothetical protein
MAGRRTSVLLLGAGVVVAICAATGVWLFRGQASAPAIGTPSPQVRRLLPKVATYLEAKGASQIVSGGVLLCGVRYLGNSQLGRRFDLYVWEACQEYRADGLTRLTGWSLPAVISVAAAPNGDRPAAEQQPRDGDAYAQDVRRMFPRSAQAVIWKMGTSTGPGAVSAMFADLDRRARHQLGRG